MFHVKHKKGGDDNVRIVLILLLMINLVLIICQQARISELEDSIEKSIPNTAQKARGKAGKSS